MNHGVGRSGIYQSPYFLLAGFYMAKYMTALCINFLDAKQQAGPAGFQSF